uniref:C2H2-type domain-containing protein n=1 Tax=Acrobeloides nanus TaxID=290746 RepID=A0A914CU43_9BILA
MLNADQNVTNAAELVESLSYGTQAHGYSAFNCKIFDGVTSLPTPESSFPHIPLGSPQFWVGSRTIVPEGGRNQNPPEVESEQDVLDEMADLDEDPEDPVGKLYQCPEPGCIKRYTYWGNFMSHLMLGKHKKMAEKTTLFDFSLNLYKMKLEELDIQRTLPIINEPMDIFQNLDREETPLPEGWALKKKRTKTNFTPKQTAFLDECFQKKMLTGSKLDASQVEELMRTEKINKRLRFDVTEWLDAHQINGYFSRKALQIRQGTQTVGEEPNIEENEADLFEEMRTNPMFPDAIDYTIEGINDAQLFEK